MPPEAQQRTWLTHRLEHAGAVLLSCPGSVPQPNCVPSQPFYRNPVIIKTVLGDKGLRRWLGHEAGGSPAELMAAHKGSGQHLGPDTQRRSSKKAPSMKERAFISRSASIPEGIKSCWLLASHSIPNQPRMSHCLGTWRVIKMLFLYRQHFIEKQFFKN